jgi:hypothetical protein
MYNAYALIFCSLDPAQFNFLKTMPYSLLHRLSLGENMLSLQWLIAANVTWVNIYAYFEQPEPSLILVEQYRCLEPYRKLPEQQQFIRQVAQLLNQACAAEILKQLTLVASAEFYHHLQKELSAQALHLMKPIVQENCSNLTETELLHLVSNR